MVKPLRAINWIRSRIRFPAYVQPKVDGVRGGYWIPRCFTGKSLKPFNNIALTQFWSQPDFQWLDGELVVPAVSLTDPALCRNTTSVTNTVNSHVVPSLLAFDYLADPALPYCKRLDKLRALVDNKLRREYGMGRIACMENFVAKNMDDLLELDDRFHGLGFEGTIIRNPDAPHKDGDSTESGMELWRVKRFIDFEIEITELIEAMENTNPAMTNPLGRTERSSAKAGMKPKGMVGMVRGRVLKDVVHDGKLLFKKDMIIDAGPGKMTHAERIAALQHPELIIRQFAKVKTFPHGVKDKPRMPTIEGFRSRVDMS